MKALDVVICAEISGLNENLMRLHLMHPANLFHVTFTIIMVK